ncbi:MAG: hypothetical protein ACYDDN_11630, partial [Candidatus Desulforudaceae bacterium]
TLFRLGRTVYDSAFAQAVSKRFTEYLSASFNRAIQDLLGIPEQNEPRFRWVRATLPDFGSHPSGQ